MNPTKQNKKNKQKTDETKRLTKTRAESNSNLDTTNINDKNKKTKKHVSICTDVEDSPATAGACQRKLQLTTPSVVSTKL